MLLRVWLLLIAGSATALAQSSELDYQPMSTVPGVQEALVDCRSPVMLHEARIKADTPWQFGGTTFTFRIDKKGRVSVRLGEGDSKFRRLARTPGIVRFSAFGRDYGLSVRPGRDRKTVSVASAYGVAVSLGSEQAYVVDSNGDGDLGNTGDGLVVPQSRTVGRFENPCQVWSRDFAVSVRVVDGVRWEVASVPMPIASSRDHSRAWRFVQWRRQQCGLEWMRYDSSLESGMRKHSAYLFRNNARGHAEDPRKPGYSKEGHQAGLQSVIGFQKETLLDGIEEQFATLFHRSSCLQPGLTRSAITLHSGIFMMNTMAGLDGSLRGAPCVYPPHGMLGVRIAFNRWGEAPMPVAKPPANNGLGTCLSVSFSALYRTAKLPKKPLFAVHRLMGSRAKSVSTKHVYFPGRVPKHLRTDPTYKGHMAFIPAKPWLSQTRYHARVEIPLPEDLDVRAQWYPDQRFMYEWEFQTE